METALTAISVISAICAIVFGCAAFARNRKQDTTYEAKNDATILTELGHIRADTTDIKLEQREQRKINTEVLTRLTAVEASSRQAHKRIDTELGHSRAE